MDLDLLKKRPPKRRDDRIILHFDYDCFYASVFENQNPALKALPLGVKQKNILATCNYVARARGVKKLMLIAEAKKLCPDLVIIEGEDLTPFRDMSKTLLGFFKSHSWSRKVERLGLDEVFMDVTDMINYNMFCLNKFSLADSFFCLSKQDPERGFSCDLTDFAGCVHGPCIRPPPLENQSYVRLLLASHLANHLRVGLEEQFGFTSTCGVSTNKLLSKLVGSKHKPRNQTTLLALNNNDGDEAVLGFMDPYTIRKIPGIGSKTTQLLEQRLLSRHVQVEAYNTESALTARAVRMHPGMSPDTLESVLGGPGAEQGIGVRVWGLLHGVDYTQVKEHSDVPSQISIEDTYKGLRDLAHIREELKKLAVSLVRRMRVDLVTEDTSHTNQNEDPKPRWMAHPKTLRLSIRSWPANAEAEERNFNRISRSQQLPNFVFGLRDTLEAIAERLTSEALFPMLTKFYPEKGHKWNLQLMNICVANMIPSGSEARSSIGRDISVMFRRQDDVLRQWKIDTAIIGEGEGEGEEKKEGRVEPGPGDGHVTSYLPLDVEVSEPEVDEVDADVSWEDGESTARCRQCGHMIPMFATSAHARYHDMGD